jgi:hypothetical protein
MFLTSQLWLYIRTLRFFIQRPSQLVFNPSSVEQIAVLCFLRIWNSVWLSQLIIGCWKEYCVWVEFEVWSKDEEEIMGVEDESGEENES